jgi:hypothetical protein
MRILYRLLLASLCRRWREGTISLVVSAIGERVRTFWSVQTVLSSEYALSPELCMGHLSLEDIYPDDVEKYGHMRVGMTDFYVKDNHAIYGVVTLGEYRELTSRLLRDEAVQMIISAKLASLPEDYDPWIWQIDRNRALHARYGDKFDPWGDD